MRFQVRDRSWTVPAIEAEAEKPGEHFRAAHGKAPEQARAVVFNHDVSGNFDGGEEQRELSPNLGDGRGQAAA